MSEALAEKPIPSYVRCFRCQRSIEVDGRQKFYTPLNNQICETCYEVHGGPRLKSYNYRWEPTEDGDTLFMEIPEGRLYRIATSQNIVFVPKTQ